MKKITILVLTVLTFTAVAQKRKVSAKDSIALNNLAVKLYKWRHENPIEFIKIGKPDVNNTKYESIDWLKYDKLKVILKETGFFSKAFLKNYKKILSKINRKLKTGELEWRVGQPAPFGFEGDIWCKCLSYPKVKKYWEDIAIKKPRLKKDGTVKFKLFWQGDVIEYKKSDFKYKASAVKEKGKWKIKTLEGFKKKDY